ncbi:hypothetical protein POEJIIAE_02188 [Mannheimia haemolytica]
MENKTTTQFDVVIVGGAVTGSVLALALSSFTHHKISIAIVEKSLRTMNSKAVLMLAVLP